MPSPRHTLAFALLSSLAAAEPAIAQDPPEAAPPVPEPPPLPARVQSGEPLEPDVRIIQRERDVVEEYRVHGRLYMIKVIPRGGRPYYLVDGDGDGNLESRFHELAPGMLIPSWVLFTW